MKKAISFLLVLIFAFTLTGCGNRRDDPVDVMDDIVEDLEDDYVDYLSDKEVPPSVLDQLDLMLDHYVSGVATPPPSSIPNTVLDPDDQDAQNIISAVSSAVTNETELEALILQSMKNVDTFITFEAVGNWLDWDTLYDIVFIRIHDVYMIDAFGLYSYSAVQTINGNDAVYELTYTYINNSSPDEVRDMRNMIESKAKQIIRDLNLGGRTDYEKIKAIDQYLCDNVYYPDMPFIPHDFTPYGALIDGRAVCDGYARATKILCDICDLDCYYVSGYCNNDPVNGGHAWNLVNVDSKWYQLDTTWDDSSNTKDYFLVTDSFMELSRAWDHSRYPATELVAYTP